ncbi:hypothetical protein FJQ98_04490 [Lysinibacillus agricola]|uniref:Uncharacterized protein n=1 Tax=Lysinibacillus agricola TaxID=2590012 RepID=A0ABX7AW43_9BACI|nr:MULTISPECIES: hypothetical protein [Lysinibacillus]QQP13325.1 hypothetical protein FJQ98_04490 [Lysinibacillus agricola]
MRKRSGSSRGFVCAKAKRQQQGFVCAKAKRQQQQDAGQLAVIAWMR